MMHRALDMMTIAATAAALMLGATSASWADEAPSPAPAPTPAPAPDAPPPTIEKLIHEFRNVVGDVEARQAIVDQVGKRGEADKAKLLKVIEQELEPDLIGYAKRFAKAASSDVAARRKAAGAEQVQLLRKQVLDLRERDGLTKAMIEQEADPAIKRLGELLVPARDEILFADPSLFGARGSVVSKARYWKRLTGRDVNDLFERFEQIGMLQAMQESEQDRQIVIDNVAASRPLDEQEAIGLEYLNFLRILLGLGPQKIDMKLVEASRDHSADMSKLGFFSHESPVSGKRTPWQRAELHGTTASAENIAAGVSAGKAAIRMWWYSPGHFKNMISGAHRVGLGRHGSLWTQMFGG